eukprot:131047_1
MSDNTTSLVDLNKLKSFTDIIVYGYIRPLESKISFISLNIIPISIIQMCLKYFAPQTAMQLFVNISRKKQDKLVYLDFINKKTININIQKKNNSNAVSSLSHAIFANDFTLSTKTIEFFNNKLSDNYYKHFQLNTNKKYNAILFSNNIYFFQHTNVFNEKDTLKHVSKLDTYCFPLPKQHPIDKNSCFSQYYGLISVASNSCATLNFNDENAFKWIGNMKFKYHKTYMQDTHINIDRVCLMNAFSSIDDKLFLFKNSGRWDSYMRIHNIDDNKNFVYSLKSKTLIAVRELPYEYRRDKFGMYYDMTREHIYCIGGNGCAKVVNRFDFVKDKWYSSNTIFEHNEYPVGWMDGFILYIAGDMEGKMGTVECLDTRMSESHWILANKDLQIDKILPPCNFKRLFSNNIY